MPKINTIALVPIPKLSDKLVGTSVGGSPSNQTNNFTLQQLKTLFDGAPAVANLQTVLNSGNTATQNIFLTGTIDATNLDISNDSYLTNLYLSSRFFDKNNFQGTSGQYLTSTGTGVQWSTLTIPVPTLQQVLTAGNISDKNITTTGNIQSANLQGTNLTANSNLRVVGTLADSSNSVGTSGQVLSSTGLANSWVDLPTYSAVSPLIYNDPLKQFSIQVANGVQSGYLSFTDWITFDSKQPAGSYITALTGEASGAGPGVVSVTLSNLAVINKTLTGLTISGGSITAADSIITAFGKLQNQINNAISGLSYQGAWNALTNVPFLQSSVGTNGDYYVVSVAGSTNLNGITDWQVGDWAIYNGTSWQKIDNTDSVVSVNGYTGAVVLSYSDVGAPPTSRTLNINGVGYDLSADRFWTVGDVRTDQTYSNPSWISSLAWGKITNTPTTLAGYGITDAVSTSRTLSINGTTYDLSANRSWSVGTVTSISTSAPITGGIITGSGTIGINQSSASSDGYLSSTDWTTFNSKQSTLSLTTIGSSGSSTLISNVLNVPTYTLSGLGGVPTTRELTINGTTYDLSANRSWSVGTVTSVGLTMPAAFGVANTPVTGSGTINVTALGNATQYIRGDGVLADFPGGGGGGGASVSYYLNGSVNQGTFGGNTYYEMSKTPVIGTGTDFSINADGYIAQFITDAGEPNAFLIPGGNWNFEVYFSASSGGGSPSFYVELYKYDGTTFTLIASNSSTPELISFGTNIEPYFTAIAVPETSLTITDRLAIRLYVNHSGRTITLHTEDNHLCQVITTFTTGLTALNGLTQQVQYFATGTSGSDFNIVSSVATHTFNLPTASSVNRGALSTTDWTTFNSKQDAISLTTTGSSGSSTFISNVLNVPTYTLSGLGGVPTSRQLTINGTAYDLSADRSWSVGTVTSVGLSSATSGVTIGSTPVTGSGTITLAIATATATQNGLLSSTDWSTFNSKQNTITLTTTGNSGSSTLIGSTLNIPTYTLSGLGGVPTSRTITINGTTQDLSADRTYSVGTVTSVAALTLGTSGTDLSSSVANGTTTPVITLNVPTASATNRGALSAADWTTFNNKQNALTNPVTGTGTTNYLPKFTGSTTIGNSQVFDNGTFVGIGTTSPSGLLHVKSSGAYGSILVDNTGTTGGGYFASLQNGSTKGIIAVTGAIEGNTTSDFGMFAETGGALRFYVNGSATRSMSLTSGGNLLVGTTSDNGARFQVNGQGFFTHPDTPVRLNNSGGTFTQLDFLNNGTQKGAIWWNNSSNTLNLWTGVTTMTLTSSGNVGIGTTSPLTNLTVRGSATNTMSLQYSNDGGGVGYGIHNSSGTELFSIGGGRFVRQDELAISRQGTAVLYINNSNNVGIGTTSPIDKLNVNAGGITFTGSLPNPTNTSVGSLQIGYDGTQGVIQTWQSSPLLISTYNYQAFSTNGTERMRITSGGNVLIGTTIAYTSRLAVQATTANRPAIKAGFGGVSGNGYWVLGDNYTLDESLTSYGIDYSSGDLVLGSIVAPSTTTSGQFISTQAQFGNLGSAIRAGNSGDIYFFRGTSTSVVSIGGAKSMTESMRINSSGILLVGGTSTAAGGIIQALGSSGTAISIRSTSAGGSQPILRFYHDGNDEFTITGGSSLRFLSSGVNERMRITSGGNVLIGTTTDAGYTLNVAGNAQFIKSSTSTAMVVGLSGVTGSIIRFSYNGGFVGSISTDGSNTAYNTSSDYRLKEQVRPIDNPLEKVLKLNPVNFKYKNSKTVQDGFIAHEIQEILPYLVTGEKDGAEMQEVDYSKLTPILIAAIKELNEKINKLS